MCDSLNSTNLSKINYDLISDSDENSSNLTRNISSVLSSSSNSSVLKSFCLEIDGSRAFTCSDERETVLNSSTNSTDFFSPKRKRIRSGEKMAYSANVPSCELLKDVTNIIQTQKRAPSLFEEENSIGLPLKKPRKSIFKKPVSDSVNNTISDYNLTDDRSFEMTTVEDTSNHLVNADSCERVLRKPRKSIFRKPVSDSVNNTISDHNLTDDRSFEMTTVEDTSNHLVNADSSERVLRKPRKSIFKKPVSDSVNNTISDHNLTDDRSFEMTTVEDTSNRLVNADSCECVLRKPRKTIFKQCPNETSDVDSHIPDSSLDLTKSESAKSLTTDSSESRPRKSIFRKFEHATISDLTGTTDDPSFGISTVENSINNSANAESKCDLKRQNRKSIFRVVSNETGEIETDVSLELTKSENNLSPTLDIVKSKIKSRKSIFRQLENTAISNCTFLDDEPSSLASTTVEDMSVSTGSSGSQCIVRETRKTIFNLSDKESSDNSASRSDICLDLTNVQSQRSVNGENKSIFRKINTDKETRTHCSTFSVSLSNCTHVEKQNTDLSNCTHVEKQRKSIFVQNNIFHVDDEHSECENVTFTSSRNSKTENLVRQDGRKSIFVHAHLNDSSHSSDVTFSRSECTRDDQKLDEAREILPHEVEKQDESLNEINPAFIGVDPNDSAENKNTTCSPPQVASVVNSPHSTNVSALEFELPFIYPKKSIFSKSLKSHLKNTSNGFELTDVSESSEFSSTDLEVSRSSQDKLRKSIFIKAVEDVVQDDCLVRTNSTELSLPNLDNSFSSPLQKKKSIFTRKNIASSTKADSFIDESQLDLEQSKEINNSEESRLVQLCSNFSEESSSKLNNALYNDLEKSKQNQKISRKSFFVKTSSADEPDSLHKTNSFQISNLDLEETRPVLSSTRKSINFHFDNINDELVATSKDAKTSKLVNCSGNNSSDISSILEIAEISNISFKINQVKSSMVRGDETTSKHPEYTPSYLEAQQSVNQCETFNCSGWIETFIQKTVMDSSSLAQTFQTDNDSFKNSTYTINRNNDTFVIESNKSCEDRKNDTFTQNNPVSNPDLLPLINNTPNATKEDAPLQEATFPSLCEEIDRTSLDNSHESKSQQGNSKEKTSESPYEISSEKCSQKQELSDTHELGQTHFDRESNENSKKSSILLHAEDQNIMKEIEANMKNDTDNLDELQSREGDEQSTFILTEMKVVENPNKSMENILDNFECIDQNVIRDQMKAVNQDMVHEPSEQQAIQEEDIEKESDIEKRSSENFAQNNQSLKIDQKKEIIENDLINRKEQSILYISRDDKETSKAKGKADNLKNIESNEESMQIDENEEESVDTVANIESGEDFSQNDKTQGKVMKNSKMEGKDESLVNTKSEKVNDETEGECIENSKMESKDELLMYVETEEESFENSKKEGKDESLMNTESEKRNDETKRESIENINMEYPDNTLVNTEPERKNENVQRSLQNTETEDEEDTDNNETLVNNNSAEECTETNIQRDSLEKIEAKDCQKIENDKPLLKVIEEPNVKESFNVKNKGGQETVNATESEKEVSFDNERLKDGEENYENTLIEQINEPTQSGTQESETKCDKVSQEETKDKSNLVEQNRNISKNTFLAQENLEEIQTILEKEMSERKRKKSMVLTDINTNIQSKDKKLSVSVRKRNFRRSISQTFAALSSEKERVNVERRMSPRQSTLALRSYSPDNFPNKTTISRKTKIEKPKDKRRLTIALGNHSFDVTRKISLSGSDLSLSSCITNQVVQNETMLVSSDDNAVKLCIENNKTLVSPPSFSRHDAHHEGATLEAFAPYMLKHALHNVSPLQLNNMEETAIIVSDYGIFDTNFDKVKENSNILEDESSESMMQLTSSVESKIETYSERDSTVKDNLDHVSSTSIENTFFSHKSKIVNSTRVSHLFPLKPAENFPADSSTTSEKSTTSCYKTFSQLQAETVYLDVTNKNQTNHTNDTVQPLKRERRKACLFQSESGSASSSRVSNSLRKCNSDVLSQVSPKEKMTRAENNSLSASAHSPVHKDGLLEKSVRMSPRLNHSNESMDLTQKSNLNKSAELATLNESTTLSRRRNSQRISQKNSLVGRKSAETSRTENLNRSDGKKLTSSEVDQNSLGSLRSGEFSSTLFSVNSEVENECETIVLESSDTQASSTTNSTTTDVDVTARTTKRRKRALLSTSRLMDDLTQNEPFDGSRNSSLSAQQSSVFQETNRILNNLPNKVSRHKEFDFSSVSPNDLPMDAEKLQAFKQPSVPKRFSKILTSNVTNLSRTKLYANQSAQKSSGSSAALSLGTSEFFDSSSSTSLSQTKFFANLNKNSTPYGNVQTSTVRKERIYPEAFESLLNASVVSIPSSQSNSKSCSLMNIDMSSIANDKNSSRPKVSKDFIESPSAERLSHVSYASSLNNVGSSNSSFEPPQTKSSPVQRSKSRSTTQPRYSLSILQSGRKVQSDRSVNEYLECSVLNKILSLSVEGTPSPQSDTNKISAIAMPKNDNVDVIVMKNKVYKPSKLFSDKKSPWINRRLYKYLEGKLKDKFNIKTRLTSEFIAKLLHKNCSEIREQCFAQNEENQQALSLILQTLVKLGVVETYWDFKVFCHDYLPGPIGRLVTSLLSFKSENFLIPLMYEENEDEDETAALRYYLSLCSKRTEV